MTHTPPSFAFIATSRTGDSVRLHEMFELALLEVRPDRPDRLSVWRMRPTRLPEADAGVMARYRYHDREHFAHPVVALDPQLGTAAEVHPGNMAAGLSERLFGTHLITLDFRDVAFVGRFLESSGQLAGWARTLDLGAVAAGALAGIRTGWYSAAQQPVAVPFDALDELPHDPYRLAQALGAADRRHSDADDAATRAQLAGHVHSTVFGQSRVFPLVPADPGPAPAGDRAALNGAAPAGGNGGDPAGS